MGGKKLFGTKVYPDAILRGAYPGKSAANIRTGGMFKNPLGKMSPEELKDFQSVLREMQIDTKPEFVRPGTINQPQMGSFKHQPFLFDEATAAEYQRRKKLNPYV